MATEANEPTIERGAALARADGLLLFVDETGGESMTDRGHPVFGLGGCAVDAEHYESEIAEPWRRLKRDHFGGPDVLLHAAELRTPTPGQVDALTVFFASGRFFRIAAVIAPTTRIEGLVPYEAAAAGLLRNVAAVLTRAPARSIATVFESSERGDRLARQFFNGVTADRSGQAVPVSWRFLGKTAGEPGLEVADFVMHTAGTQVRQRERGDDRWRKDFAVVFQGVDPSLVEFAAFTRLALAHNPSGTIPAILIDPSSRPIAKPQR